VIVNDAMTARPPATEDDVWSPSERLGDRSLACRHSSMGPVVGQTARTPRMDFERARL